MASLDPEAVTFFLIAGHIIAENALNTHILRLRSLFSMDAKLKESANLSQLPHFLQTGLKYESRAQ